MYAITVISHSLAQAAAKGLVHDNLATSFSAHIKIRKLLTDTVRKRFRTNYIDHHYFLLSQSVFKHDAHEYSAQKGQQIYAIHFMIG